MFFHKQLVSRMPFYDGQYSWCLRESTGLWLAPLWSEVKCKECSRINRQALAQQNHPLHPWAMVEEKPLPKVKIERPQDILPLLADIAEQAQEHFMVIALNSDNSVIASRVISMGLVDQTQVHPREVFADVIKDRAKSVILGHNHPSHRNEPSLEDINITEQLVEDGRILGIDILDHVIVSRRGYYSFLEHGRI